MKRKLLAGLTAGLGIITAAVVIIITRGETSDYSGSSHPAYNRLMRR